MSQEGPVDPGESILRRIPRTLDYYDPSLPVPVLAFAFRPNQRDTEGISLYRELFVSPERVAHRLGIQLVLMSLPGSMRLMC